MTREEFEERKRALEARGRSRSPRRPTRPYSGVSGPHALWSLSPHGADGSHSSPSRAPEARAQIVRA